MAKSDSSPLLAAATAFDEQLAIYARLGELFMKTPLASVKQLERANQLLGEIADCEQRLQDSGKELILALTAARQRQEELAGLVVAHAPAIQERNQQLKALMNEMAQLAQDAAAVTAQVVPQEGEGAEAADPGVISASVLELSNRAEQLATTAREAEFEEIAAQAHALHQRLKVIAQKLQRAAIN